MYSTSWLSRIIYFLCLVIIFIFAWRKIERQHQNKMTHEIQRWNVPFLVKLHFFFEKPFFLIFEHDVIDYLCCHHIISICTSTFFCHHGSTPSLCHVVLHCYTPNHPHPCPATFPTTTTTPAPPCTAWGGVRVRTCRLPLIWVTVIQFSGCYKPARIPTPPSPISLTFPGHKMCLQPPMWF